MSSLWDRFLGGFDPPEPEHDVDAPLTVFDEMDELHAQRVERHDPTWFPRGGGQELARLARRRRREQRVPSDG